MAGPRPLDTEIPTKNPQPRQAGRLLRPRAGPGARHKEPPCAAMPARLPAAAVVWWWRWGGDDGVPGPVGGGSVAGGVVRGRGAAAVRGGE